MSFLALASSLDVGLGDVGAVELDVDLGAVLLSLLLSVERPPVADQVERQQEAQHAQTKEADVDLRG